jgi:hypothetical protein
VHLLVRPEVAHTALARRGQEADVQLGLIAGAVGPGVADDDGGELVGAAHDGCAVHAEVLAQRVTDEGDDSGPIRSGRQHALPLCR